MRRVSFRTLAVLYSVVVFPAVYVVLVAGSYKAMPIASLRDIAYASSDVAKPGMVVDVDVDVVGCSASVVVVVGDALLLLVEHALPIATTAPTLIVSANLLIDRGGRNIAIIVGGNCAKRHISPAWEF